LAVISLPVVDAGTEMLGVGIEKNANYRWRDDLVLLGYGGCFIYSALAWPLLCDHMICDARYLVMLVICEVENGTHLSLHHASNLRPASLYYTARSHICKLCMYLKNYKSISGVRCTACYFPCQPGEPLCNNKRGPLP
jgi:hypothetical protein